MGEFLQISTHELHLFGHFTITLGLFLLALVNTGMHTMRGVRERCKSALYVDVSNLLLSFHLAIPVLKQLTMSMQ